MNLYRVRAKSGEKYVTVYVRSFTFSQVEACIMQYCFKGFKLKKFSEIVSITLVANETKETFLDTFK